MQNKTSKTRTKPFVIAIAGGTGSGKSLIARKLRAIAPDRIVVVPHDHYYKDHSHLPLNERKFLNYDYPGAFDNKLFIQQLKDLKAGKSVSMPHYSFAEHVRTTATTPVHPAPVVITEGILVLSNEQMRKLYDLIVFVDVDDDIRLARRLMRDAGEGGRGDRSYEESLNQYLGSAQPMHDHYVQPGMEYAHIVIKNNGTEEELNEAIELLAARIKEQLGIGSKVAAKKAAAKKN